MPGTDATVALWLKLGGTAMAVINPILTVDLEPVQLIGPDGSPTAERRYSRDLPPETLTWLYEMMIVTRDVDEELVNLQRQGQLALYPSCRGQEAAQVGATACLPKTDWLFPQYRELGVYLVRGIPPGNVGAMWRGTWHGGLDFTDKHCAPMAIPIGTHGLHAVGAAMAARHLGEDSVTVAFLGDGGTSTGDAHEAFNSAAVFTAPCVFYVQNNQWAISVPVRKQTVAPSIAHKAIGYGMPGIRVDGNDVLACYAVMTEAAARARAGEGPTLIEALTYRLGAHTTSDDPTRYRPPEELATWTALDPIPRYRAYLDNVGVWSQRLEERVSAHSRRMRAEVRSTVFDAPDIDIDEVFTTVFAEMTPGLEAQRRQLRDELMSTDGGAR
jgi:pyruvate dehydrogenase E1 component alpha subunit